MNDDNQDTLATIVKAYFDELDARVEFIKKLSGYLIEYTSSDFPIHINATMEATLLAVCS